MSEAIKITEQTKFINAQDYTWRDIEEELVCMNLKTGEYYTFSDVGRTVWLAVTNGQNTKEVTATVRDEFDVTEDVANEDVKKFITELLNQGLINPVNDE